MSDAATASRPRVVLADDHPIVLAGLSGLIHADDSVELVGVAATGLAALTLIRETEPDVAVIDIFRTLILSLHEDRTYLNQALQAGARGYALKRSAPQNLLNAIRAVFVGGLYVDPAMAGYMFDTRQRRSGQTTGEIVLNELTGREAEVLKLTALGETNKEIARQLDVSVKTVETFKGRGIKKLGLKSRAEIVRYAATQGWFVNI
ncbi:MAG: two component uxR family transcriptional regulator [Deltaproteobacteria bacterium]|nr:two component uxR family transcriptional regulator [Deltaproteobacteria bacterium]